MNNTDLRLAAIALRYRYGIMGIRSIVRELAIQENKETAHPYVYSSLSAELTKQHSVEENQPVIDEEALRFLTIMEELSLSESGLRALLLRSGCLVLLVSTLELLVAELIREYLRVYPKALASRNKSIEWKQLLNFRSLDEFINTAISQYVEEVMRNGIDGWAEFFDQHVVAPERCVPDWDSLYEAFQRRHVIVHNGGLADRHYLNKVSRNWLAKQTPQIVPGTYLVPQIDYLDEKIWLFLISGLLMCDAVWAKLVDNGRIRENVLRNLLHDLLRMSEWNAALLLCKELLAKSRLTMASQIMFRMDACLCKKKLSQEYDIVEDLADFDPSIYDAKFVLAYYALCDDRDRFFEYLREVITTKQISEEDLEGWPIFDDMRTDPRFGEYVALLGTR